MDRDEHTNYSSSAVNSSLAVGNASDLPIVRHNASGPLTRIMTSDDSHFPRALRYAFNPREYELIQQYLIRRVRRDSGRSNSKANTRLKSAIFHDDYHAATIRASLRVFVGSVASLKAWELISTLLLARGRSQR